MTRILNGGARILRIGLIIILSANLLISAPVNARAPTGPTLQIAGLKNRVIVRRDERGVPYIEAANESDLYFAQGYVTASDRLWQMDLLRRTARGELAEVAGKTVLEEDKRHRIYGFAKLSEQIAAKLPATQRAMLEAYANGVNAFIASRDEKPLPPEFRILKYEPRPWTPADT